MAKRLLSLVVAMLLVLSLAPVALANNEAAIAAVAAEAISTEPLAFVTKNLTLPVNVEGTQITWQSSDPSVIATDGTVKRHNYADKTVTLTASVGAETIATHKVTVLSNLKKVGLSDTFKVADEKYETSYVGTNGWTGAGNTDGTDTIEPVKSNNNSYLELNITGDSTYYANFAAPLATYFPDGIGTSKTYTMEFDFKTPSSASGTGIQFVNDTQCISSNMGKNAVGRITIHNNTLSVHTLTTGNNWFQVAAADGVLYYDTTYGAYGTDLHVKYVLNTDVEEGNKLKFSISINGDPIVVDADAAVVTSLATQLGFGIGSRTTGVYTLDNLVVYTEDALTDDVINGWNDAQKVEFFASKVDVSKITATPELVTSNLDLAAALTGYTLANYGVDLTWSSSNPARITSAGVVDNTNILNEDVTMTATVSCGEASKSLTKTVTVGQSYTTLTGVAQLGDFNNKTIGDSVYSTTNSTTQVTTHYGTFVQDDEEHGIAAKVTNGGTIPFTAIYQKDNYTKRLLVEAELKFVEEDGYTSGNPTFTVYGQGGAEGTVLTFDFANRTITAKRGSGSVPGQYLTKEKENVTYAMPASVQENEWFNVAIDYVAPSKGMQVYVNGALLNEIPLEAYSAYSNDDCTNSTVRGWGAKAPANSSLYIDNVSIKIADNEDITKVDAALNAFKMVFLSNRHVVSLSSVVGTLPAAGPADGTEDKTTTPTEVAQYTVYNPLKIKFEGGAALSYKINGKTATGIDTNTLPSNATIEVTATSNDVSKTITANVNIGSAGVAGIRSTGGSMGTEFDSIHVIGDVVGKKVVVALVDDEGIIYQTKIVTIEAKEDGPDSEVVDGAYRLGMNGPSFWDGDDAVGKSLKIFILDENLKPCSMPYLYKIVTISDI